MLELKVAVQLGTLHQPFRDALDSLANFGVQAVELDLRRGMRMEDLTRTAIRQILKLLDDRKMRICSVRFATRRGYDDLEGLERRVEATKQAMTKAFELGATVVCNPLTHVPETGTDAWTLMHQVLFDLARHSSKVGASLALSTQVPSDDLKRLLDEASAGVVLELDPAGVLMAGSRPVEVVEMLGDRILHVRVRDAIRDQSRKGGQEVQVGRGMVDFPELLGKLEERQYQGWLMLGRDDPETTNTPASLEELGAGIEFLRNLWR